jgi:hypothetical protein
MLLVVVVVLFFLLLLQYIALHRITSTKQESQMSGRNLIVNYLPHEVDETILMVLFAYFSF